VTDRSLIASELAAVRGQATTECVANGDPDAPARAIRRALAAARMKAADVGYVNISCDAPDASLAARAFERGLGRHHLGAILDMSSGGIAQAAQCCAVAVALRTTAGRARLEHAQHQLRGLREVARAVDSRLRADGPAGAVALEICINGVNRALALAPLE